MSDHPNEFESEIMPDGEQMPETTEDDSVIDIATLRRAQSLLEEMAEDPALESDVLAGFDPEASDQNLDRIAEAMKANDEEHIRAMEALAMQTSQDLLSLNADLVADDTILETPELREQLLEEPAMEPEAEEMSEQDAALLAALPRANHSGEFDLDDLQSCMDALLFYSDRPISLKRMKELLELGGIEDAPLLQAIEQLKASYQTANRGFEIAEVAGGYQLRTKPNKAPLIRKLAKVQIQRLSRGAMETLTICAYKQPCTKDDIDQIRGVDSSHFIRTLLDRKLIEVTGRSEAAGRPMIYTTTDTFLEVFGLMALSDLPPLREIEAMVPQLASTEEGAEDPRVIQMRKLVTQMKTESNHLDYDAREDEKILQEIRERVKTIDISTPYLERQKELASQGITGEEAEAILTREFGFETASSGGEPIAETVAQTTATTETREEEQLSMEELAQIASLQQGKEKGSHV